MKYKDKEIKDFTDDELSEARQELIDILEARDESFNDPRYKRRFGDKPPPEPNPKFLELQKVIDDEIWNRLKVNKNV